MFARHFIRLFLAVSLLAALPVFGQQAAPKHHRQLPYPPSNLLYGLYWTAPPHKYPGTGSDMHWWMPGPDGAVYVVDDDGSNFGGPGNYAHLLRITGVPPAHKVETVTDFMDIPFRKQLPDPLLRRYVNGPVAIGSALYIAIYNYDWNLPQAQPYRDSIAPRMKLYEYYRNVPDSALLYTMYFIDSYSKNHGTAGFIKSTDLGKTWTSIPDAGTPRFLGPRFGGLCFVQFGPGYTEVPPELGPYVYALSNDGSWETGDNVFMARVHRDSLLVRGAWQFLSGFGKANQPLWSGNEEASLPVFTDKGHVGHPTISYNKALKRYILGIYSDVTPHRENATVAEWNTWDQASEMQLYESRWPWGPWKLVHSETPFGGAGHTAYLPQIPNSWWSGDGLGGTVMFAGDYKGAGEYYALMTRPFRLGLKKKPAAKKSR